MKRYQICFHVANVILLSIFCHILLALTVDSAFFKGNDPSKGKRNPFAVLYVSLESECLLECSKRERCHFASIRGTSLWGPNRCELYGNDTSQPLTTKSDNGTYYKRLQKQGSICFGLLGKGRTACVCKNGQYPSCWDALQASVSSQGTFMIQPRCLGGAVKVECKSQGVKVITTVSHTVPANTLVNGYEDCGSYKRTISYHGTIDSIVNLMKDVDTCRQLTELDCQYVLIYYPNGTSCSWLIGRGGNKLRYWGGGDQSGMGCECWKTRSCIEKSKPCNCSNYDTKPGISDRGYVTKMADLPLRSVAFGDTGSTHELLKYTIGPLQCETLV